YTTLFRDGAGEPFVPLEVVGRISAAANGPVYGFVDQNLGHGIVGGNLYSLAAHGPAAARLVLPVLCSDHPPTPSFSEQQIHSEMFDWRQLQRWGISENRLPPKSEVLFRPTTDWERYRWEIIAIAAALSAQALLIGGLLIERRRRRRAEESARDLLSVLT